ncbi:unnamed protein product [Auanema sp. JU1783]|nr:unnamed protein product [Auanema sp. JU1783]
MSEEFLRSQVASHNNSKSCWIIVGNKVYDVTKFLDEHPGGCEVLLELAGQDATEAFEDIGHSSDARAMKEEYLVGSLEKADHQLYSYDKRSRGRSDGNDQKRAASPLEGMVMPVLVAVIVGLFYYLLV